MNDEMGATCRVGYFFCLVSRTDIPYVLCGNVQLAF
jgi:hypothetical protein